MRPLVFTMALCGAAALSGCSTEYGLFSPTEGEPGAPQAVSADRALPAGARATTYTVDPSQAGRADYLFVVDDSVSMLKVLKRMRAGFESLDPNAFPRDARIAVMSTTPASIDRTRPHPTVTDVDGALRDPGFLRLIRGSDIAAWKGVDGAEACGTDGWFRPGDALPDGTSCLEAVTELPLYKVNAEAGLVAVKQLLQKQGSTPLFRDGAAVNIIFVSDTHDPGLPPGKGREALIKVRPDFDELAALVAQANVVSSLKVHAIAPQEPCVEVEDWSGIGTSYYDVALASGGRIVDVCKADDYRTILRDLAEVGAIQDHDVVELGDGAGEVIGVEVNGRPVDWSVHRNGRLVRIDSALAHGPAQVRVITK